MGLRDAADACTGEGDGGGTGGWTGGGREEATGGFPDAWGARRGGKGKGDWREGTGSTKAKREGAKSGEMLP